jgi:hypothetical protein
MVAIPAREFDLTTPKLKTGKSTMETQRHRVFFCFDQPGDDGRSKGQAFGG